MTAAVHILILAAGASSRMRGADKLMQPVGRDPLVRHVAGVAMATAAPVTVTLSPDSPARRAALAGLAVTLVDVPDARSGMARSLIAGLLAIQPDVGPEDGLLILPADMPGFTTAVLVDLIARFRAEPGVIIRGGTLDGKPGHPVIFPRDLWPDLLDLSGDEGGRSVLKDHHDRVRVIPLPGRMAVIDLDTPEDWALWRSGTL